MLRRVQEETGPDRDSQIERAFALALGRKPSPRELEMSHTYLNELQTIENQPPARAMQRLCLLVLNLNEFLYPRLGSPDMSCNHCNHDDDHLGLNRREFLHRVGGGFTSVALAGLLAKDWIPESASVCGGW